MLDRARTKDSLDLDERYGPFIGGKFLTSDLPTFDAVDPATGDLLAKIARCGRDEVDLAVQAAHKAFPSWKAVSYEERAALLHKLADALEKNLDRLSTIDAMDVGRRIFETRIDYMIAVSQYRYFAGAILTHEGYGRPIDNGYLLAQREPYGVCGQIIPWNVPAIMTSFKLAPALAAGNTVVLKPDENASLSTMEFAKIVADIFPPGVINIVPGFGEEAGAALAAHPGVKKLAFTGSGEIGKLVAAEGAKRLVPVSLELGGKSPSVVYPDIDDIEAVVDNVIFGFLWHNGQACFAGTRLFLHEKIYDDFIAKLVGRLEALKLGDAFDDEARVTCLVSAKQGERVLKYIQMGKDEGARLLTGGKRVVVPGCEHGYFIAPTVFEVDNEMQIAREEIFGPVLSVIKWSDRDTMIEQANDTSYGLAAGVYTSGLDNAMHTAGALQAGSVWVNSFANLGSGAPFGGYKESGIGREYGREALNMYSQIKAVTLQGRPASAWFAT